VNIREIETPAILVRSKALYTNLEKYQKECARYGKELWPMIKTHKSTRVAELQKRAGAEGFLCGTLDECEALCEKGYKKIMYAYPVADQLGCRRAAKLAKTCEFYARIDTLSAAKTLNEAAEEENVTICSTIIVDCGLHRFGIEPAKVVDFARKMDQYHNLKLVGISTHSGHVYAESEKERIWKYVEDEIAAIHTAVDLLRSAGYSVDMVTSGTTPTFWGAVKDDYIGIFHPGNYVFNDCIQMSTGTAAEEECALVVYATIISHPRDDLYICDAGAKCLGLDMGAHGNASVKGHGRVIGHPEAEIIGLSEEVGKIHVNGSTDLKVGDHIMIIPNHSCSSANLTDYYIVVDENDLVEETILVDIRGNKRQKPGLFKI